MVFYITFTDFDSYFGTGLERKFKGQIEALEKELGEIYLTFCSGVMVYLMAGNVLVEKQPAVTRRDQILVLCDWLQKYRVSKTYIRYAHLDKWFINLLRFQKEYHIRTVLEIASYPYDGEMGEGILKTEDMCYRGEMCGYVDRIATYSVDDVIWGVPCINLVNGISGNSVLMSRRLRENKKIVMVAVSSMQPWHGYERIIEGMYLYYKKGGIYDIRLKMIGDGPEERYYKELVETYHLSEKVEFLGRISPQESERLDEQYDLSDIAIGTLGAYKTGFAEASPIKGSEYCAKGIPFVCAYRDLRFPPNWEFMLKIPNNSMPVEIDKVIAFYEKLVKNKDYREEMKKFAMEHLTWDSIMRPVADYFLCEQKDRELREK